MKPRLHNFVDGQDVPMNELPEDLCAFVPQDENSLAQYDMLVHYGHSPMEAVRIILYRHDKQITNLLWRKR
jgi:hypothetical protein